MTNALVEPRLFGEYVCAFAPLSRAKTHLRRATFRKEITVTIIVGNLAWATDEASLQSAFGAYGRWWWEVSEVLQSPFGDSDNDKGLAPINMFNATIKHVM